MSLHVFYLFDASSGSHLEDYKHLLFLGLAARSYSLTLVDVWLPMVTMFSLVMAG